MAPDEITKLVNEINTWDEDNNLWYIHMHDEAGDDKQRRFDLAYQKQTQSWKEDLLALLENYHSDERARTMLGKFLVWKLTK